LTTSLRGFITDDTTFIQFQMTSLSTAGAIWYLVRRQVEKHAEQ